ncbi:MAG: Lrp/AsnC ligand binding domain-containing protein [Nitrospira sp.]|nr:Lrp/AsnC ligand binding domain-containing protein [Nitrospira sp.]MCP9460803.1 Lrp/AsnC ligand binding domain-containing protein [Nitrospira sp.]MCP9475018.1 Lrp/AsnC ligand binding domain-containing protein [Nitrospira sp.]
MHKPKSQKPTSASLPASRPKRLLTAVQPLRYSPPDMESATIPYTIHAPETGAPLMSDRAYILINVIPGQTSSVVRALSQIKEVKTIDPCWGKPDIIAVVEVQDQEALTQLVLKRLHGIDGITQTDTHLVYKLAES